VKNVLRFLPFFAFQPFISYYFAQQYLGATSYRSPQRNEIKANYRTQFSARSQSPQSFISLGLPNRIVLYKPRAPGSVHYPSVEPDFRFLGIPKVAPDIYTLLLTGGACICPAAHLLQFSVGS